MTDLPTPTNDDILAAQLPKTRRNEVDHPPAEPPAPVEWSKQRAKLEAKKPKEEPVSKTLEPETPPKEHGHYKTRDSKAK